MDRCRVVLMVGWQRREAFEPEHLPDLFRVAHAAVQDRPDRRDGRASDEPKEYGQEQNELRLGISLRQRRRRFGDHPRIRYRIGFLLLVLGQPLEKALVQFAVSLRLRFKASQLVNQPRLIGVIVIDSVLGPKLLHRGGGRVQLCTQLGDALLHPLARLL